MSQPSLFAATIATALEIYWHRPRVYEHLYLLLVFYPVAAYGILWRKRS